MSVVAVPSSYRTPARSDDEVASRTTTNDMRPLRDRPLTTRHGHHGRLRASTHNCNVPLLFSSNNTKITLSMLGPRTLVKKGHGRETR